MHGTRFAKRAGSWALLIVVAAMLVSPAGAKGDKDARTNKWLKRLQTNDADANFLQIQTIARKQNGEAAFALFQAGADYEQPHLAVACGEALASLDQADVETLCKEKRYTKWLKKTLKGGKVPRRQLNLARMLGAWGHPMVDEPMAHLCSGRRSPQVQVEALFMSGYLRSEKYSTFSRTRKSIQDALSGRSDEIRCAAASAAGARSEASCREQLVSLVRKGKGDYAGLYAVWALKRVGYTGGITTFASVVGKNPKRETRNACLKAITELAAIKDVDDLLAISRNNGNKDLRDAAVLALGRLPWRIHRGRPARGEGAKSKAVVTGDVEIKSKKAFKLADPKMDVPDKVIQRLIQIVREDKAWEVRDAARQALIRFGERAKKQLLSAMSSLVNSGNDDAALTGIELAGLFGAKDVFDHVKKVALHDDARAMRMAAARALEGIDPDRAVQEIVVPVRPRKRSGKRDLFAIRVAGYIRTRKSFDEMLRIATDDAYDEAAQREAELAMERLTGHRFGRKRDRWTKWLETAQDPFFPRASKFDRKANRREAIEKGLYGLTKRTERAVENGLRWLEQHQHAIGSWDGNEKGFGGVVNCEPAYTGLSMLAFLGAGYSSAGGKYREVIRRGIEFLCATQYYDGGFPVTGGGDSSWIYAYLIGMAIWGINEAHGLSGDEDLLEPAQWGIDYLVRVQTPGQGWRYGPRYTQSDTSCTSWVLMTTKMADMIGLDVSQRSWDGVDDWLERCSFDITGEEEILKDLSNDFDYEVGVRRYFKAFTSYFKLSDRDKRGAQKISMTAVGMVCRFFMGWKRSHPYMIGSANFLKEYLPKWMKGMEKDQNVAWYHYYWYYGTLAMHQMGGKYWRNWNQTIRKMYPEKQRLSPPELAGSWDPDPTVLNGGRIFSTAMSVLSLETYYRFSPLLGEAGPPDESEDDKADEGKPGDKKSKKGASGKK